MARPLSGALKMLYGLYALPVFAILLILAAILALLLPGLDLRRRATRAMARLGLKALLIRLRVEGLERLPADSCVVIANHSSYLDGIVMKAALPPRFSFVIKQEAAGTPVLGLLLRRIGSEFVDRTSHSGRQRDARRMMRRASEGHSLVFFPEGTFATEPGLKRFHTGAFATAARAGIPVVPTIIHGARHALPNRALVPRPGTIRVEILDPLDPDLCADSAEALRDEARRLIAGRLDEPDLLATDVQSAAPTTQSRD
jgi:1-acyl-sn-glycerol-3-phosphate acyltransferase